MMVWLIASYRLTPNDCYGFDFGFLLILGCITLISHQSVLFFIGIVTMNVTFVFSLSFSNEWTSKNNNVTTHWWLLCGYCGSTYATLWRIGCQGFILSSFSRCVVSTHPCLLQLAPLSNANRAELMRKFILYYHRKSFFFKQYISV